MDHMSISDLTRQATIFAPAPFAHQHDIPEFGVENQELRIVGLLSTVSKFSLHNS
jgi:hypothetical protein